MRRTFWPHARALARTRSCKMRGTCEPRVYIHVLGAHSASVDNLRAAHTHTMLATSAKHSWGIVCVTFVAMVCVCVHVCVRSALGTLAIAVRERVYLNFYIARNKSVRNYYVQRVERDFSRTQLHEHSHLISVFYKYFGRVRAWDLPDQNVQFSVFAAPAPFNKTAPEPAIGPKRSCARGFLINIHPVRANVECAVRSRVTGTHHHNQHHQNGARESSPRSSTLPWHTYSTLHIISMRTDSSITKTMICKLHLRATSGGFLFRLVRAVCEESVLI